MPIIYNVSTVMHPVSMEGAFRSDWVQKEPHLTFDHQLPESTNPSLNNVQHRSLPRRHYRQDQGMNFILYLYFLFPLIYSNSRRPTRSVASPSHPRRSRESQERLEQESRREQWEQRRRKICSPRFL